MPYKDPVAQKARNRRYYLQNKEKIRAYGKEYQRKWQTSGRRRIYLLRFRYGITVEAYEHLLKIQHHSCAICGNIQKRRRLHVDHCHTTGQVRGLLCDECNFGLGKFQDNPKLLRKALAYLKAHKVKKEEDSNPCLF